MSKPRFAVAVDEPVSFGAGVVLVDHRSEPLDHRLFGRSWARRRSVDDVLQRRHVALGSGRLVKLQHPHEHGRHDLAVRDFVLFDELQVALGVKVLHGHDGHPECMHRHTEAQWGCMVKGRRRQVPLRVIDAKEHLTQHRDAVIPRLEWLIGERSSDALRHASRARGIEHVHAGNSGLIERLVRLCFDCGLVGLVAIDGPVEHQPQFDVRCLVDHVGSLVGLVLRRDVRTGAAIVDDVLEFGTLEA